MLFEAELSKLKHRIQPCYIIVDETGFFAKYFLEELKKNYLPKVTSENMKRMSAKDLNLAECLDDLKTISLFAPKRLFICDQAQELKKIEVEQFVSYLKSDSSQTTCIVFFASKKTSNPLTQMCTKTNCLFEFKKPYDSQLQPWVSWMAKRLNKTVDFKANRLILEKVGNDLNLIDQEIQKLALYVGNRSDIQEEDVRALLYATRSHSIFELLNAVGAKDKVAQLQLLHRMLEEGESEVFIFSMLLRHLRQLWKSIEWMEDKSESEIQKELGIHPFFWNDFRKQRDRHMNTEFQKIWDAAQSLDIVLKSQSVDKQQFLISWVNSL